MSDLLQQIQQLQFTNRSGAEALLLNFVREIYAPDVAAVELRPLAVSLNSFNGFMTLADGKRLFFKTHTEPDTVIHEYYNAAALAQAGYLVIRPIFSSTEAGKQFLVYDVIESPSVFDVAWAVETGQSDALPALTAAQNVADDHLLAIYRQTLEMQPGAQAAQAPIHQLFYHRLMGGRLARFYAPDVAITLPGTSCTMREVRQARWEINGQVYADTLDDIIERSIHRLNPAQSGPSVVGHGDAHNGNVFFRADGSLLYFDPAFAGRHHPLLDLTKPLFHNVFAMWLYFPLEKYRQTKIALSPDGDLWRIEYDYALPPVREMFLRSKIERVLIPTLQELKDRAWLRDDWRTYLKSALFCCPFLTMNLTDSQKFPPEISLLGLAMAVEMGAESQGKRSRIDAVLDEVERQI
ncbi:MAG: phosphotransferase [Chloroflexi bacterium]|nr:phosphotransferase [Chloroflexota bacterium]